MVHFQNVSMVYPDGTKALAEVDLHFERGEFVWQAVNKDFDAGFQSFGANILDGLNFFGF